MTRIVLAAAFACALAGCQSLGAPRVSELAIMDEPITSISAARAGATIKEVASERCSVVPTSASIAAVVAAAVGTFTINGVADALCGAFRVYEAFAADKRAAPTPPARPGERVTGIVVVNGKLVPVEGKVEPGRKPPAK